MSVECDFNLRITSTLNSLALELEFPAQTDDFE
jgi:hypothetical protein